MVGLISMKGKKDPSKELNRNNGKARKTHSVECGERIVNLLIGICRKDRKSCSVECDERDVTLI